MPDNYQHMRLCIACAKPILQLKQASYVPVGAGLRLTFHSECINELLSLQEQALAEEKARWQAIDTVNALHREAQGTIKKHL